MTNAEREKLIAKHMKTLDITREEAEQLIADDEAIDKGAKLFELDKEQECKYLATAKNIEEVDSRKTVIMAAYNSLGHYCNEEE